MNQPPTNQPSGPYQPQPPYQPSNQPFYNDQTQAYPQQSPYPYGQQGYSQQVNPYAQPIQRSMYPSTTPGSFAGLPTPRIKPKRRWLVGCGVVFFALLVCGLCSSIINATNHQTQASRDQNAPASTTSESRQTVHMTTYTPTPKTTAAKPEPTLTPTSPAATPTTISQSTPTSTQQPAQPPVSQPTPVPIAQPAQPTPAPISKPTQPPAPQPAAKGVNGNPWGYDFNPGSFITDPPADFCSGQYFSCIKNFPNGLGYVVRCNDGMYSRSGGRRGSCSRNGGEAQILYSH